MPLLLDPADAFDPQPTRFHSQQDVQDAVCDLITHARAIIALAEGTLTVDALTVSDALRGAVMLMTLAARLARCDLESLPKRMPTLVVGTAA